MHVRRFAPSRENACPAVPRLAYSRAEQLAVGALIDHVTLWDELARPAPGPIPTPVPVTGLSQRTGAPRFDRRSRAAAACAMHPSGLCSVPRRALF